jgi:anti-sigma factor RsiW
VTPEETERFLDLAGFVDRWLDEDDRERVAALIARDPDAAADAAAARALRAAAMPSVGDAIIARAVALADPAATRGEVVPFPAHHAQPRGWRGAATWSSLAAAILLASWLGFDLGSDLPGVTTVTRSYDDVSTSELLDPAPLMLREFTEGSQI